MLASVALAVLAASCIVFAGPVETVRTCGSTISQQQLLANEKHFAANRVSSGNSSKVASATVSVYWHLIKKDDTLEGGNTPDSQISDTVDMLNRDYAGTAIRFALAATDYTTNSDWFSIKDKGGDPQTAMKRKLRRGGPGDLNVYTVGSISDPSTADPIHAYATFPAGYNAHPQDDGVVIILSTLPGGSAKPFNLGKTLTHQVGHWFGLYDTFQGGCDAPGDHVDDTPAEGIRTSGCPVFKSSCDNKLVEDPIHNYMDTSDDACMNQFTPGQGERARGQAQTYRGITFEC